MVNAFAPVIKLLFYFYLSIITVFKKSTFKLMVIDDHLIKDHATDYKQKICEACKALASIVSSLRNS